MCVPVLVAVVVLVILYLIVRIFYLRLLMRASKIVWLCVCERECVCVCVLAWVRGHIVMMILLKFIFYTF